MLQRVLQSVAESVPESAAESAAESVPESVAESAAESVPESVPAESAADRRCRMKTDEASDWCERRQARRVRQDQPSGTGRQRETGTPSKEMEW